MMTKKFLAILSLFYAFTVQADDIYKKIQLRWDLIETGKSKANPVSRITIINPTEKPIVCKDWSIWFNFMRRIDVASVDNRFSMTHENGDLYRLGFKDPNLVIPAKGKLEINYVTKGLVPNFTDAPAGLYVLNEKTKEANEIINYQINKSVFTPAEMKEKLKEQYVINTKSLGGVKQLIIPEPQSIQLTKGQGFTISKGTHVVSPQQFAQERKVLTDFFKTYANMELDNKSAATNTIKFLTDGSLAAEAYKLTISGNQIVIKASDSKGAFYAVQTIKSLMTASQWKAGSSVVLPLVNIEDSPRFGYRGVLIDVARNFHDKKAILKVIDVMAMYKLNTLHLHLIDDEGWRLEIKSLPELTEVGSRRSAGFKDGLSLQPSYGSGASSSAKDYYTEADFIDILKYAKERHIEVVTEIETPGHARASIKSMQARYEKYMKLGNKAEAEKYLLHDMGDVSVYRSAQYWDDNVMNVAMPSTYRFISTVIDEVQAMYKKAGVELKQIHLGGDEVPRGSWEKSPKIRTLMDSLKMTSVYEVWPYYIAKVADLCASKGLKLAGWEEMGMINEGKGMRVNPELAAKKIRLDVWNNIVGGGQEDLAYRLANAGYEVVYTSANNFYLDLAWRNTFEEPGHTWAGFIDLYKSYSFLPTDFFLNITEDSKEKPLAANYFDKKERLTAKGKNNIIGIKSGAWAEKMLTADRQEYMLYPRLLALAERAWAKETVWEKTNTFNKATFDNAYRGFVKKVGEDELQKLNVLNGGYDYRLPAIGVKAEGGKLLVNTEYPGFDVYYTDNGEEPGLRSKKTGQSIVYDAKKTYKFRVITTGGRMGEVVSL